MEKKESCALLRKMKSVLVRLFLIVEENLKIKVNIPRKDGKADTSTV